MTIEAKVSVDRAVGVPYSDWPSPPAQEAFHGLAGDIVRTIEPHSEADPVALLVNLLVAFGNVVGRKPFWTVEADQHFMNLFVVLVGETAKARKGSSWGHVRRLLRHVDARWADGRVIEGGLSSGEGLVWAVRDPVEKDPQEGKPGGHDTVALDSSLADRRLLVVETEFSSTLKVMRREGNTLSAIVRQAWDKGDLRILTKNSPARATGVHLSLIAHISRPELLRYLDDTEAGNGFANRFLWLAVRRSKVLPEGGNLRDQDLEPAAERLRKAVVFAFTVGEIRRNEHARRLWSAVYPTLSEGKPGLFGAVTSRAEAQVMRLACIYALMDKSPEVDKEHLLAALALWDYCEASVRYIFGDALGDPVADTLLKALREAPEGLTRTQISDLFRRHQSARRVSQALTLLEALGLAQSARETTDGRPVERWVARGEQCEKSPA